MDDFLTDSEDEMFESAEESLDENEDKLVDSKEKKNKHSHLDLYSETKKPVEVNNCKSSDKIELTKKNVTRDSVIYRKRPERSKSTLKESLPKTVNMSRSFRDDSKSIKDVINPDNLFQDITTNLSKNINKSLNTIQQTSSNVKDLIFNSFPVAGAIKKNMFFYDDVGFHTKSPPVEGNVHFSDKVSPSESYHILDSKLLKDIDQANSFNLNSEVSKKYANNTKSNVTQSLKGDTKNDVTYNINNLCNEINAIDLDNQYTKLMEISGQKDIDSETIVLESEDNDFNQQKTMPLLSAPETEDYFRKEEEKSIMLDENNSNDTDSMDKSKSLSSSILPDLDLICETPEKNIKDIKPKQCESILESKNKEIKVKCETSNYDLVQSATNKTKETALFKNLYKSKNQNKNKLFNTKKEEILEFCDLTYSTCEQLPQIIDDTSDNVNEEKSDHDAITWKDPITNWINKTTFDNVENQINRNFKEELQKKSKNLIDIKSNEKDKTNDEKNLKLFKSDFGKIADNHLKNIVMKEESSLKERNDEWDDFDFSDSENTDLEVASVNEESEKSTLNFNESNSLKSNESKKNSLSSIKAINNSKECDEHKKFCQNQEHKEEIVQELSSFNPKSKELNIIEVKNKSDDWNWEDWDSDDNNKMEPINDIIEEDETKENYSGKIWSGWETFGKEENKKQTNWGSWGVNLLLNKASAVTQGISSALENSLGAPDAQTLAKMDYYEKNSKHDQNKENTDIDKKIKLENTSSDSKLFSSIGITDLVVGVTSKIVDHSKFQEIGSKVINGGLDTLESFGKKTMEVLQDGDPLLRNKRALLLGEPKPTLSQVLKEIKDKTEKELKEAERKEIDKKCHFESMFDDYQGLIHLEALEMLSKQCELKLEQIRNSCEIEQQEDFDGVLEEVQQLCSLDDYDLTLAINSNDFEKSLIKAVSPLKNEVSLQKIFEVQKDFNQWLQSSSSSSSFVKGLTFVLIEQKLVSTLAKLTAATIQQYHKAGELLSVKECRKTVEEIDALSEMTHILIKEIGHISNSFISLSQELFKGTENLALLVNKIDIIMNNSTTYIKQAFTLLIPVLQMGAAVN